MKVNQVAHWNFQCPHGMPELTGSHSSEHDVHSEVLLTTSRTEATPLRDLQGAGHLAGLPTGARSQDEDAERRDRVALP